MPVNSPRQVTATFITGVTDGRFDEAEEVVHSEGPLEGTGELLVFFSIVFTQFLLQFVLPAVPTEVSNITVVEQGASSAEVHAEVTVTTLLQVEMEIELRTENSETPDDPTPVEQWRVWDVDVDV